MGQITFKDLDKKQKIEHIWEYYKWHIIGPVIAIFCIVSIVTAMMRPRPPVFAADLVVAGKMLVDDEKLQTTKGVWHETMNMGVDVLQGDWSVANQYTMANDQMLSLKFQMRQCDVLALSTLRHEGFMAIDEYDAFAALDEIPELTPLLEKYQDSLITKVGIDGKEHVYGIRTNVLHDIEGITLQEDYIVSLLTNPKDEAVAINLMLHILQ